MDDGKGQVPLGTDEPIPSKQWKMRGRRLREVWGGEEEQRRAEGGGEGSLGFEFVER